MNARLLIALCLAVSSMAGNAALAFTGNGTAMPPQQQNRAEVNVDNPLIAYMSWTCTAQSSSSWGSGFGPTQGIAARRAMMECRIRTAPYDMCFIVDCSPN